MYMFLRQHLSARTHTRREYCALKIHADTDNKDLHIHFAANREILIHFSLIFSLLALLKTVATQVKCAFKQNNCFFLSNNGKRLRCLIAKLYLCVCILYAQELNEA